MSHARSPKLYCKILNEQKIGMNEFNESPLFTRMWKSFFFVICPFVNEIHPHLIIIRGTKNIHTELIFEHFEEKNIV